MSNVSPINVAIVVFAMPGCPACEGYLPKLLKQVEGYRKLGYPFIVYEIGYALQPGQIPVLVYDLTSADPSVQAFANQHKIENAPTTVLLPKVGYPARFEGDIGDDGIYKMLNMAVASNG